MRCTSSTICTICPRHPDGIQMVSIGYPYGMCRSYFDSKAVYSTTRPMCHKRGFRVSGGECGPVCAMWHPFGLPSPIRGGANVGSAELHDRCCPFTRYLGKKSPDNAHQKSWECAGPVGLFWGQYAGVILCQKKVLA